MNENSAYKRFEIVDLKYQVIDRHHKGGELFIGKNVYIDFGVTIDVTGNVTILDNAVISEGVMILSHKHNTATPMADNKDVFDVVIGAGAWVGPRSIINCPSIGANAYLHPGSVCLSSVPNGWIVCGNPAKMVRP
jgi:acetyltransferase-like isoleucine patch superfamily enzyme